MQELESREGMPRADEAERHLIGLVLEFPAATAKLASILPLDAFYSERYRAIYNAALNVLATGMEPNIVTIRDRLFRNNQMDVAGGEIALMDLTEEVISMSGLTSYARLAAEYWVARETIQWARDLNEIAWKTPFPFEVSLRLVNRTAAKVRFAARHLERLLQMCAQSGATA